MRRSLVLVLISLTLAAPRPSRAGVCVEIDSARDVLEPQEQHGAVVLLSGLLEDKGMAVSEGGCDATYRIYHLVFGQAITVMLSGPNGSRQTTVRAHEDLPAAYSQLVNALVDDVPISNSNSTVNRFNVTRDFEDRPRVEAEKVFFARLGATVAANTGSDIAHGLGFGLRYELDTMGVEMSFANMSSLRGNASGEVGSLFKLLGQYYFDPISNSTPYLGAGCSWGRHSVEKDDSYYEGSGLQLELVAGQEMLRASTIRLFVEASATLPLYNVEGHERNNGYASGSETIDDYYSPYFSVMMGIGFGGNSSRDDHHLPPHPQRLR